MLNQVDNKLIDELHKQAVPVIRRKIGPYTLALGQVPSLPVVEGYSDNAVAQAVSSFGGCTLSRRGDDFIVNHPRSPKPSVSQVLSANGVWTTATAPVISQAGEGVRVCYSIPGSKDHLLPPLPHGTASQRVCGPDLQQMQDTISALWMQPEPGLTFDSSVMACVPKDTNTTSNSSLQYRWDSVHEAIVDASILPLSRGEVMGCLMDLVWQVLDKERVQPVSHRGRLLGALDKDMLVLYLLSLVMTWETFLDSMDGSDVTEVATKLRANSDKIVVMKLPRNGRQATAALSAGSALPSYLRPYGIVFDRHVYVVGIPKDMFVTYNGVDVTSGSKMIFASFGDEDREYAVGTIALSTVLSHADGAAATFYQDAVEAVPTWTHTMGSGLQLTDYKSPDWWDSQPVLFGLPSSMTIVLDSLSPTEFHVSMTGGDYSQALRTVALDAGYDDDLSSLDDMAQVDRVACSLSRQRMAPPANWLLESMAGADAGLTSANVSSVLGQKVFQDPPPGADNADGEYDETIGDSIVRIASMSPQLGLGAIISESQDHLSSVATLGWSSVYTHLVPTETGTKSVDVRHLAPKVNGIEVTVEEWVEAVEEGARIMVSANALAVSGSGLFYLSPTEVEVDENDLVNYHDAFTGGVVSGAVARSWILGLVLEEARKAADLAYIDSLKVYQSEDRGGSWIRAFPTPNASSEVTDVVAQTAHIYLSLTDRALAGSTEVVPWV